MKAIHPTERRTDRAGWLHLAMLLALTAIEASAQRGGPRQFQTGPVQFAPPPGVKLIADVNYRDGSDVWRIDLAVPARWAK